MKLYFEYDIALTIPGLMDTASDVVSIFQAPRKISLFQNLPNSLAHAGVAPATAVSYNILINGTVHGTVNFAAGSVDGSFTWTTSLNLDVGDVLTITTPSVIDSSIKNVTIDIVGVAEAVYTAMLQ
jgi:hypothetical protein